MYEMKDGVERDGVHASDLLCWASNGLELITGQSFALQQQP